MKTNVLYLLITLCILLTSCTNKQKQQTTDTSTPLTEIKKYKNPYIGNNANTVNLFNAILLTEVPKKYQIDSDRCILTVHLEGTANKTQDQIRKEILYTTIASMAAIQNLSAVIYDFPEYDYTLQRKEIETILGAPLSNYLDEDKWNKEIQSQINNTEFIEKFYK